MKKKIVVISIIISVLLIGIVSASLLDFFGKITGSVEVKGPVFYAGKTIEGEYKLWINNFEKFQEENVGTYISIKEEEHETFFTETFDEEIDFYNPQIKLSVKAKLVNESLAPKRLELEFGYFDENPYGDIYTIGNCRGEIEINSAEVWEIKSFICQGDGEINNFKGFYYSIRGRGTGEVKINVKLEEGETKAGVLGVAQ